MKYPLSITAAVIFSGMCVGYCIGRIDKPTEKAAHPEPTAGRGRHPVSGANGNPRKSDRSTTARASRHDLRTLIRFRLTPGSTIPDIMREIERMSVAELKESALALLSEGGPEYAAPEAYIREKIIRVLLEELFLREGIRSLQWADALEYPGARAKALEDLVGHLAETDPATSREWMDRMRIELGENAYRRWLARACRGAAGRSAADLVDLTRLFGRDCYHLLTTSGPFADDFDFKTFWSGCLENGVALHQIEPATAMFASQDRDAAISTIGRLRADGSGTLSHSGSMDELMKGVLLSHGRKDATAWLIGKLDQLGETARVEAVQALYQREDLDDLAALESVCRVLPTAGDRVALIARATEHGAGNAADALRLLASDSERADALTETLGQRYDFKISLERVAEIERLMDETGMSETARASVRAHWENE